MKTQYPLYYIGLALINLILGKKEHADKILLKALSTKETDEMDIGVRIEFFLKISQFHYENRNFKKSINDSKKVIELTNPLSREYAVASAFAKINQFNLYRLLTLIIFLKKKLKTSYFSVFYLKFSIYLYISLNF